MYKLLHFHGRILPVTADNYDNYWYYFCPWSSGVHHLKLLSNLFLFVFKSVYLYLFIYFIYMKGRAIEERVYQRDLPFLAESPNTWYSRGWARVKTGSRNSIHIPFIGCRNPRIQVIICCPQSVHQQEVGSEIKAGFYPWCSEMWYKCPRKWPNLLFHSCLPST